MMRRAFQLLPFIAFALILFVASGSNSALAQGSSGGSIGNDDKSVSGSRSEPRSVESDKPVRPTKSETEAPDHTSRRSGGGGGNFDGTWAYVGIGTNCRGAGSGTLTISGGRVIVPNGSGSVTPSGAYHASVVGSDGVALTATGRLSGNSGGGTYRRADGCAGRWSATRQ
jgi:hypothetical protein